jgi:succinoglycan biosynthesis transport protein ExoP
MTPKRNLTASNQTEAEPDINLARIMQIVRRRSLVFLVCLCIAVCLSVGYLVLQKRRYRAEAQLQVLGEDTPATIADINSSSGGAQDALQVSLNLQTYAGILQSDNLALRVIEEEHLEAAPDFNVSRGGLAGSREKAEGGLPLEQSRYRREKVLQKFKRDLNVSIISGSKLISVAFYSTDPDLAKRALNRLLTDFVDYNFQVRFNATTRSEDWLGKRLVDLKSEVEQSQEHAVNLQKETGIFGTDETHNLVVGRLQALDEELTNAEQNRIVKESVLRVVESGDPEAISSLSGTAGQSMVPGAQNSLALVQTLRQEESSLEGDSAELASRYGPNFPRLLEKREKLVSVKRSITQEIERLRLRAENDYKAAALQESLVRREFNAQKQIAHNANDIAVEYSIANREANSKRDLYQHLLEKAKEVDVLSGIRSTNIDIVDAAHVSSAPVTPQPFLVLGIGAIAGAFLGLMGVFCSEIVDGALHGPDDLEGSPDLKLLGVVPKIRLAGISKPQRTGLLLGDSGASQALPLASAESAFIEAFRIIRTSIALADRKQGCTVILITSPMSGEGKTTVAVSLAGALALQGVRVLLVDGDLRKGTLTEKLGHSRSRGLSEMINSKSSFEAKSLPGAESLSFIPSGAVTDQAAELLTSQWLEVELSNWRNRYDWVIVDSAPCLPFADALAFSQRVDGVILVARSGVSSKQSIMRAAATFADSPAATLGTVLNGVNARASDSRLYIGA